MHALPSIFVHVLWLLCSAISVRDTAGRVQKPFEKTGQQLTVFFFVAVDCPISNGYAPEINRIIETYAKQNVKCFLVYENVDVPVDDIKRHVTDFGFGCPALIDSTHELRALLHATKTPEAAVVDADVQILYRGRIDNWYSEFGKHRPLATVHDLRDVLEAALAGKPVPTVVTKVVGCPI